MKRLKAPLLVVNFKAYIEATGKRAVALAKVAERVAAATGVDIIVAPQFVDVKSVSEAVAIPVFGQHLDPIAAGAHTGHVLADSLKSAGAEGSLLNHSEKRLSRAEIQSAVGICLETDLYSLVCADTAIAAAEVAKFHPDMIAIEPPFLIGSGVSVSKARPEMITEGLRMIKRVSNKIVVLCGAGVTTAEDVSKALDLGTEGVLVASSVVKTKDSENVLSKMADAMIGKK